MGLKLFFSLFLIIICTGCSSTSWVADFVMYEGEIYSVTDSKAEEIGEKLGEVQYFLDTEGDAPDFSSNYFPVGTELYSIEGIDVDEAIAVKDEAGNFIKLTKF